MTALLIRLINPNNLRKLACRLVGRLQLSRVWVKRVLVVIGLPGAAGVWTAVILTLELEGGTASEKQSHQNTVRLHGRARKRWDISVHHRCCGGQTAPLQTTFTLTPITDFLVAYFWSRLWWMEMASGSILTPKCSDRCSPLFLQWADSVTTQPTSHNKPDLFEMTAVFVPTPFHLSGWACVFM